MSTPKLNTEIHKACTKMHKTDNSV